MDNFKEYIISRGTGPLPSPEELDALLASYPWFMTARVVRGMAGGEYTVGRGQDPLLALHLSLAPLPAQGLYAVSAADLERPSEQERIIEQFLAVGEHRITPPEEPASTGIAAEIVAELESGPRPEVPAVVPEVFGVPDNVTEELAEIYMRQGHWPQAKEAYEKLSLLYPKKSVYFAEIIERINAKM